MCGVVKLSISSLTAHTAGHGLDRDVGKVRPSVWVQTRPDLPTGPVHHPAGSLDPVSPIHAALVLSDCRHRFSNVACCKQ
jgi:hypothetical protein